MPVQVPSSKSFTSAVHRHGQTVIQNRTSPLRSTMRSRAVVLRLTCIVMSGRIEIDNNAAERALRAVALGRKNYLFAGAIAASAPARCTR